LRVFPIIPAEKRCILNDAEQKNNFWVTRRVNRPPNVEEIDIHFINAYSLSTRILSQPSFAAWYHLHSFVRANELQQYQGAAVFNKCPFFPLEFYELDAQK